jgi:CRISPR/Cas system-associated endonuclease Cas1
MKINSSLRQRARAMKSAYAALSRLEENPPENISELRGLEANCAASYFRSWARMPINGGDKPQTNSR